ncbi:MAG: hypothetical protein SFX74_05705 [Fimbriimonadaceae bacterium]|nr:hypothetical protein [Fimbriimonadaceae bacterium]
MMRIRGLEISWALTAALLVVGGCQPSAQRAGFVRPESRTIEIAEKAGMPPEDYKWVLAREDEIAASGTLSAANFKLAVEKLQTTTSTELRKELLSLLNGLAGTEHRKAAADAVRPFLDSKDGTVDEFALIAMIKLAPAEGVAVAEQWMKTRTGNAQKVAEKWSQIGKKKLNEAPKASKS